MLETVPIAIKIAFILSSLLGVGFLLYAIRMGLGRVKDNLFIPLLFLWMMIQAVLAFEGFYLRLTTTQSYLIVIISFIPIGIIIFLLRGPYRQQALSLPLIWLTFIHTIRMPIEWIRLKLYYIGEVPYIMTLKGYNWDLLFGITAILILFMGFDRGKPRKWVLLIWNIVGLTSLLLIIIMGVLTVPVFIQPDLIERANTAVLQFPFIWLPSVIIPILVYCHIASIIKLAQTNESF